MKRFVLYYRNVPYYTSNVRSKVEQTAWRLTKDKGFDSKQMEIKDSQNYTLSTTLNR